MAVLLQSAHARGQLPAATSGTAGTVVTERYEFDAPATLALNNVIEIGCLPARTRVTDMVLIVDDLDGGTAISLDVGLMEGEYGVQDFAGRACGDEFFSADTTARTGGVVRMTRAAGFRVAAANQDRGIGVKVRAAATTPAAGKITLLVSYVA